MTVWSRNLVAAALLIGVLPPHLGFAAKDGGDSRDTKALLGCIPAEFRQYKVILDPDRNEPEWWAGAPKGVLDFDSGCTRDALSLRSLGCGSGGFAC